MQKGFFLKYEGALEKIYRSVDLILILFAFYTAHFLKFSHFSVDSEEFNVVLLTLLLSAFVFKESALYRPKRGRPVRREIVGLLLAWGVVVMLMTLIGYLTKMGETISREWAILTVVIAAVYMIIMRVMMRVFLKKLRAQGRNIKNAVIYGINDLGTLIAERLEEETWAGVNVIGFFDDNAKERSNHSNIPVLGGVNDLIKMIESSNRKGNENGKIDQVWITLPLTCHKRINEIVETLQNTPVQIQFVPDWTEAEILRYPIDQFAGISILNMSAPPISGPDAILKNIFDKMFALAALLLIWPIMLVVALLIKLESQGPVLFKQRRYGIDGKEIEVWKFRSMHVCEDGDIVPQAKKQDNRVTKIGSFIRKWSLDELPQFINVLKGTMSVVGPRPHAVAHNEYYRDKIPRYMARHIVKPGITGWAQVNGWRGETDTPEKMQQRVKHDFEYISKWNLWLDLRIIFLTIFKGFKGESVY